MPSSNDASTTGGVVAGIVICLLLFLVVVALFAYNVYLYLRRRATNRRHRERHVTRQQLHPGSSWRPREYLYSSQQEEAAFRGSGTVNAGYQGSAGSVASSRASSRTSGRMPLGGSTNVHPGYSGAPTGGALSRGRGGGGRGGGRGAGRGGAGGGPAPRAQYEDDSISSDDGGGGGGSDDGSPGSRPNTDPGPGDPSGRVGKQLRRPPLRGTVSVTEARSTGRPNCTSGWDSSRDYHHRPSPYNPALAHAHAQSQSRCGNGLHAVVAVPRPEVTLRPQQLVAQWDRKPPPPPMFRQQRRSADGERTSCLAVLTAEAANMRVADVRSYDLSLTGCGAQTVPNFGLVPPSGGAGGSVLNGGFQYNCY